MINIMLIIIALVFSTAVASAEKESSKHERILTEYQKRVKKSCSRIKEINDYYLVKSNNIRNNDDVIMRLIKSKMIETELFLDKYKCSK